MSTKEADKKEEVKVEEKTVAKPTKKTVGYFKNTRYSALKILVRGGKDDLDALGIEEEARFVPYYDIYKGDTVRVGYLKTESKAVIDRCKEDFTCEEIEEKEYNQAVEGDSKNKPLKRAPIPQA